MISLSSAEIAHSTVSVKIVWRLKQVSLGDNFHEVSDPIF